MKIITTITFPVPENKKKKVGSLKVSEGRGGVTLELMSSSVSPTVLGHPTYAQGGIEKVLDDYSVLGFIAMSRVSW